MLVAHSLRAEGFDASEDGTGRGTPLVPVAFSAGNSGESYGIALSEDHTPPLRSGSSGTNQIPTIAFTCNSSGRSAPNVMHASAIRRLTPIECERLQGFEDSYTAVPYRGKPAADGPRYRALGNSMAVPVVRWIGERIARVEEVVAQRAVAAS